MGCEHSRRDVEPSFHGMSISLNVEVDDEEVKKLLEEVKEEVKIQQIKELKKRVPSAPTTPLS